MVDLKALRAEFIERFSSTPEFFRAPGRVNLIGEHTDYNAGFVMPAAIQFYTTVGIAPRSDRRLRVRSTNFAETLEAAVPDADVIISRLSAQPTKWIDYVLGVAYALEVHGVSIGGADLLIHGDVPIGAGLSSSAALEVAVALALSMLAGSPLRPLSLAKICQKAENDYVGMRCGIMDQFAAVFGRAAHALKIDCRSLEHELVPLDLYNSDAIPAVQIVICNTMVRHKHAGGEYNRRREQCERGVSSLKRVLPDITALRDVTPAELQAHEAALDPLVYRRCRHIVTENERVVAGAQALKVGALEMFGQLMRESHQSMRVDYEISCHELDLMVRLAESIDGVYGARMTGGGFGGCTVNFVRMDAVTEFRSLIAERYTGATGLTPEIYVCKAADGAGRVQFR
jgi:galactokinase